MEDFLKGLKRLEDWSNGVQDKIEAGQFEDAELLCAKLLQHYPDQIDGHHRLAAVREAQGRWAEAISAYDRALLHIERNPDVFDHEMVEYLQAERARVRKRLGKPAR